MLCNLHPTHQRTSRHLTGQSPSDVTPAHAYATKRHIPPAAFAGRHLHFALKRVIGVFVVLALLVLLSGCATWQAITKTFGLQTVVPIRTASQLMHDLAPSIVRVRTADGEGTGFVAFEVG